MTREEAKDRIMVKVISLQGCKATQLSVEEDLLEVWQYSSGLIDELVQEGKLIEVTYSLPQMPYRLKSFLLPAGTSVQVTTRG